MNNTKHFSITYRHISLYTIHINYTIISIINVFTTYYVHMIYIIRLYITAEVVAGLEITARISKLIKCEHQDEELQWRGL